MDARDIPLRGDIKDKILSVITIVSQGSPAECPRCHSLYYSLTKEQSSSLGDVLGHGYDFADIDSVCGKCAQK